MNNNQSKGIIKEFAEILNQIPMTKEKIEALDKNIMLIEDKTKRNESLSAIDYVTTLELIKYFANFGVAYVDDKTNLYKLYKLLLEEIEPALDDLTLDSLLLVISQFKTLNEYIKEYNNYFADERKAKKVLRPIDEEMRKKDKTFKKLIKKGELIWNQE